jgi:cbb3-type cytochrome oxidase subunit 1
MVMGVGGFIFTTPSYGYLCVAVLTGIIYGTLDSLELVEKRWPMAIAVFSTVMVQAVARDRYLPKLAFGEKLLHVIQFLALWWLFAVLVVWLFELVERRRGPKGPVLTG